MADKINLLDPKTGQIFEAADQETAEKQMRAYGLQIAGDQDVQNYDEQQRSTGFVDKAKAFAAATAGEASEFIDAASQAGIGTQVDELTGTTYGGDRVYAERLAPFAYTPENRERVRANPNTAAAATVGIDLATSALIPQFGVPGMLASAAASGLLTEAGATYINDDEYSLKDAALASGAAFALEGAGALAITGAMKAKGLAKNYLDAAVDRARRVATEGAEAETDVARAAEQLRRNSESLYTKHQTELDDALAAIDERTTGAPDRLFTPGALRKTVSENVAAQEDAFINLAVKFDQAAEVTDVPGFAEVAQTLKEGLGKDGAGMFEALHAARKQLDGLGAVENRLIRDAATDLTETLRSQATWGKAADNYAKAFDDVGSAADTVSVNVREPTARDALDQRLDRARRLQSVTGDKKLAANIKRAEAALEKADKVTGARILGETTPDEIKALQKQIDAFPKRAPKLAEEIRASQSRLNKTFGGTLGEMTEDEALDYVAARASGVGSKTDPMRQTLVDAEKRIAAMKARGEDPTKVAKATAELSSFRKTVAEANDIPRATQRIRDWEARPQPGGLGGKIGRFGDDVAVEEIQNAIQPMLHGAGMTIGAHVAGVPGAIGGYLGGRAINKAFGERIARYVWKRAKSGAVEFAKKNPLEAAGAVTGAMTGTFLGPKGVVAGAVAGQRATRAARAAGERVGKKFSKALWGEAVESAEKRAGRSVGAAGADAKRGVVGEAVKEASTRAGDVLEDLEKLAAEKVGNAAESAGKAWEATKQAAQSAQKAVSGADVSGAATAAAQRVRHVAGDAVRDVVDAAQKAGAKAPEVAAAAKRAAKDVAGAASSVAKSATAAAKRTGAKAADVARAASDTAGKAAAKVGNLGDAAKGAFNAVQHAARAAATAAQDVARVANRAALKTTATARSVATATAVAARKAVTAANNVARAAARSVRGAVRGVPEAVTQRVAKVQRELEDFFTTKVPDGSAERPFKAEPVKTPPNYAKNVERFKASLSNVDRGLLERALEPLPKAPEGMRRLDQINARLQRSVQVFGRPTGLEPSTKRVVNALNDVFKQARSAGHVVHGEFYQPVVLPQMVVARLKAESDHYASNFFLGLSGGYINPPPTLGNKAFVLGTVDAKAAHEAATLKLTPQMRQQKLAPVVLRINSRGAVPVSNVEAIVANPGARFLVKRVTVPQRVGDVIEIHLEDISATAQRRMAKVDTDRFTGANIKRAKVASQAVDDAAAAGAAADARALGTGAGRTTAARKALLTAIDAAKNNPDKIAGAALLGASLGADDDTQTAGAAAASAGLLLFFLPKGGKKLLANQLDNAFEALVPAERMRLRQATHAVAEENEELLRAFAAKKSPFKKAEDVLNEQFGNYQKSYAKQNRINLDVDNTIPEDVLDAMQRELEYRNAAIIEADPELHRLAEVRRFDVVKGEGKGVQGVPELRRMGLPEPGEVKIRGGADPGGPRPMPAIKGAPSENDLIKSINDAADDVGSNGITVNARTILDHVKLPEGADRKRVAELIRDNMYAIERRAQVAHDSYMTSLTGEIAPSRQGDFMAGAAEGTPEYTITPEEVARARRARNDVAAEELHDTDMPGDLQHELMQRIDSMVEDMPSGLSESDMFKYVDNRILGFELEAKRQIPRPLNEREKEFVEAAFYHHATGRNQELARVDDAIAKDTARTEAYKAKLGDVESAEPDSSALMKTLPDDAEQGWRDAIEEVRAERPMLDPTGAGFQPDEIDEAVNRIKERHIVDPADEIFIRKELGQEAPDFGGDDIDDVIDDAVFQTAAYADDFDIEGVELTADDIIRQIENGETRLGNHDLTPWEEYHIREKFDEDAVEYQSRFDDHVERNREHYEAEREYEDASEAERRGLKRDRNEDGERYTDDGLPQDWALESVGLKPGDVKVYDNKGIENVFGDDPLTMRDMRGMFALDELRQFAKAEGSELKTSLHVETDSVHFEGSAGGGSFHITARAEIPHGRAGEYKPGEPTIHIDIAKVPEGSGWTKRGVLERMIAAFEARGITNIQGKAFLGMSGLALAAGAKALHDQAQQARDEVRAARMQMGREEDVNAALDHIERVDRTREKLGYLKTENEFIVRDTARAVANDNHRDRNVNAVPGVTHSQGVARFLGSHDSLRDAFEDKRKTFQTIQQNPMALVDELTDGLSELQQTAPGLHGKMVQQTYKVLEYLQGKMPATIGASLTRPEGSPTNPLAIRQFALYYSAATDPSSVMGDLANNRAQREQIDTLKELWPDVYTDLKLAVVDQLSKGRASVAQRQRLDLLFDFGDSLERGLSNRLVAALAEHRAKEAKGGADGGTAAPPTTPSRRTQPSVSGTGALGALAFGPAAGPGTLA